MNRIANEEAAARWLARRNSGHWSSGDEAEFTAWLESSIAHRMAYLQLHSLWERTAGLKALAHDSGRGVVPRAGVLLTRATQRVTRSEDSSRETDSSPRWRQPRYTRAIAAGVTTLALVAALLTFSLSRGDRYVTAIGATQTVSLQDGSQVTLNTDTSLRVELTDAERRIQLSRGEAFFSVAPNKQRPFVVEIDGKRVTAVGTQFSVRKLENDIMVVVAEGVVRVELKDHRDATLGTGDTARSNVAGISVTRGQDAAELLSWREGWIRFDNIALSDAVAELNRYTPRQIRIRDSSLDNLHLSGKFRTNNIESFLELLEKGFSVSVQQQDEDIVLSKR